jgi:Uma2 family endonuclease
MLQDLSLNGLKHYYKHYNATLLDRRDRVEIPITLIIGNPKQPTIFVCELVDGEYQMTPFQGNDLIVSPAFPQLNLTAQQIFDSVC